jgi:hypothetical protein
MKVRNEDEDEDAMVRVASIGTGIGKEGEEVDI